MNKRISRIMGVMVSLTLIASLFTWAAVPVAAAPGDMTWFKESIPSTSGTVLKSGSDVAGFAVADASTIYAIDSLGAATAKVYRSTNAGQSFTNITNNLGTSTTPAFGAPVAIAVAPDNKDVVAVTDGTNLWTSSDSGTTWTSIGSPAVGPISSVAVGPARSGTLLGREYFVSVSGAAGDVMMIGGSSAVFVTAAATSVTAATHSYLAVAVSPNFLGDRTIVALGVDPVAGVRVQYINTASGTVIGGIGVTPFAAGILGGTGLFGDIALPTNFDPTTSGGRRAFVAIASTGGAAVGDDVYRIDDDTARALGSGLSPRSVAYSGTVDAGTLFAAANTGNNVKKSTDPTVASPTWKSTDKAPAGAAGTLVRTASDFATTNRLFAATTGADSAFSISNDAAVTFSGEAFMDMAAIANIDSIALTPDGATMYMLTRVTAANDNFFLWKSVTPVTSTSWSRIFFGSVTAVAGAMGILKLNPDYATTPAIFIAHRLGTTIWVSQNGGNTFSSRTAAAAVGSFAVQDAQVAYMTSGGNIYKSTNAGFIWGTAVSTGITPSDMIVPKADTVLVAGTAQMAYSTNGGASWTSRNTGLDAAIPYKLAVDGDYANNAWAYVAGNNGSVKRLKVGTGTQWEGMNQPAAVTNAVGIDFVNNALYVMDVSGAAARVLNPTALTSISTTNDWAVVNNGTPVPVVGVQAASAFDATGTSNSNFLYVTELDTTLTTATPPGPILSLYSISDFVAVRKPTLTAPADNLALPVNPNTGTGDSVTLRWEAISSGTAFVDQFDIEVAEKANGFTGSPTRSAVNVQGTDPFFVTFTGAGADFARPNVEYIWRVRAARTTNGAVAKGPWSGERTVKVQAGGVVQQTQAGVILTGPAAGSQNVNPALVGFSWAPIQGATEYQIIVATDAALASPVGGTPARVSTTSYQVTGLNANTTYFWAVKATLPTESQQSIGTFTTAAPATTAAPQPTVQPTIIVTVPPSAAPETPAYIWAVIAIGAILVIAVIILIVRTRRVP